MTAPPLPPPVTGLATQLAGVPGAVAVALGGSRATGDARPDSDWDVALYYRGSARVLEPADVRALGHPGHVSELGEWGPIVHGGAWLDVDGLPVDVLFRDLDVVEHRLAEARAGRFDVMPQQGHLVGAPTYGPVAELARCLVLMGDLPRPDFPETLAAAAPPRWRERAGLALLFADGHAAAGDAVACTGQLVAAALCEAHARLAARGAWVRSEKGLLRAAGLDRVVPVGGGEPRAAVAAVATALDVAPLEPRGPRERPLRGGP